MLDQYWHGEVSRISPEAPVPVVHVRDREERAGGAANVALGIAALGGKPSLLGLIGADPEGETLERLLREQQIDHCLIQFPHQATITKLRILGHHHQMMRLDKETPFTLDAAKALRAIYLERLETTAAVILSDYDKGTLGDCSFFIDAARKKGVPVIVDPKKRSFAQYRGATLVTPNMKEFDLAVGSWQTPEEMVNKARLLLKRYDISALVLTRSEKGLMVIPQRGEVSYVEAQAQAVHDVTGAGDTVAAVLGLGLAAGLSIVEAANLANIAAGIAVSKLGAAVVSFQELVKVLHQTAEFSQGVVSEEALLIMLHASKGCGERIVFTNGCFDLLHAGHVMYLEQAKNLGDRLVVGVNSDESVRRLKGATRPINPLEARMAVLAALKSVDWVVPFSEETPERLIEALSPDVLVKGGDYPSVDALAGARHVKDTGGEVRLLSFKDGCSTTAMVNAILAAEREEMQLREGSHSDSLMACHRQCACREKKSALCACSTLEA